MDTLEVKFAADGGVEGVDADPMNPLARALARLLQAGRPFERIHVCYFDPSPIASGKRWLGVFVSSAGGRVLYFPGLRETQPQTQASSGHLLIQKHEFRADHLSLEADRRTWHLTEGGSRNHMGAFPTTNLRDGRVLWFGMSVASADVLRPVMSLTEIKAPSPPTDSRRRADVIVRARDGVVFNVVQLNNKHVRTSPPLFAHFSVIAGPCGFPSYQGEHLGLPFGSPFVSPALPALNGLALRSHRVCLDPDVDLEIITSLLPGRVTVPVTFTSPVTKAAPHS